MPSDRCDPYEDEAVQAPCFDETEPVSLCEVLDRVLNKGVVVVGHLTISVADVDLIYLGLQLVLTSMETARQRVQQSSAGIGLAIDV